MPGSFCWDKSIPVEVLRWEAANSSSPLLPAGRHPGAARKMFFKSHHGVKKCRPESHRPQAGLADGRSPDGQGKAQLKSQGGTDRPWHLLETALEQEQQVGLPQSPVCIDWYQLLLEHRVGEDWRLWTRLGGQSAVIA